MKMKLTASCSCRHCPMKAERLHISRDLITRYGSEVTKWSHEGNCRLRLEVVLRHLSGEFSFLIRQALQGFVRWGIASGGNWRGPRRKKFLPNAEVSDWKSPVLQRLDTDLEEGLTRPP
eukprot:2914241-Rhodomonas_salina.2